MNRALAALAVSLPALVLGCAAPVAPKGSAEVLPFIENDYGHALDEARAKKLPLFVDVWTPW
jgi:hypothetical protein